MGSISLQIPQSGQPNSTEDPKVASNFTALQTVINGNLDDTNLSSPNNAYRRLLLQASSGTIGGTGSGDYLLGTGQFLAPNVGASPNLMPPFWVADSGLSSQPQDFQVTNKSAKCRIRALLCTNTIAPAVTFTVGLYSLIGLGGAGGTLSYGVTATNQCPAIVSPAANQAFAVESAEFAMPTTASWYALGVKISGGIMATNSAIGVSAQLYGYSA